MCELRSIRVIKQTQGIIVPIVCVCVRVVNFNRRWETAHYFWFTMTVGRREILFADRKETERLIGRVLAGKCKTELCWAVSAASAIFFYFRHELIIDVTFFCEILPCAQVKCVYVLCVLKLSINFNSVLSRTATIFSSLQVYIITKFERWPQIHGLVFSGNVTSNACVLDALSRARCAYIYNVWVSNSQNIAADIYIICIANANKFSSEETNKCHAMINATN